MNIVEAKAVDIFCGNLYNAIVAVTIANEALEERKAIALGQDQLEYLKMVMQLSSTWLFLVNGTIIVTTEAICMIGYRVCTLISTGE